MRACGDDECETEIIHRKVSQSRRRGGDDDESDQIPDPIRQVREIRKKHPLVDAQKLDGRRRAAVLLRVKSVTENLDAEKDRDRDPRCRDVEEQRAISAKGGDVTEPVLGSEENDSDGF